VATVLIISCNGVSNYEVTDKYIKNVTITINDTVPIIMNYQFIKLNTDNGIFVKNVIVDKDTYDKIKIGDKIKL
jgi:hypothetical protein